MKLFEIRDVSDYRRGDESDPRSPYYEDPLEGGVPDYFQPSMPEYVVRTEGGTAPNGEQYAFSVTSKVSREDRNEGAIDEMAWDGFAGDKRFTNCEIVDEHSEVKGGYTIYTQFLQAGRGFPVGEVLKALQSYAKDYADKLAEKSARDTIGRYGRDWQRYVDY